MMCVAGYEIGRSCSLETLINLSHEVVGVLTATSITIIVSIVAAYMNVVVVAQALRLFCVVLSVPFLSMQMLDESEAAVALEKVDELPWPVLIPIMFCGLVYRHAPRQGKINRVALNGTGRHNGNVRRGLGNGRERPADFGLSTFPTA